MLDFMLNHVSIGIKWDLFAIRILKNGKNFMIKVELMLITKTFPWISYHAGVLDETEGYHSYLNEWKSSRQRLSNKNPSCSRVWQVRDFYLILTNMNCLSLTWIIWIIYKHMYFMLKPFVDGFFGWKTLKLKMKELTSVRFPLQ